METRYGADFVNYNRKRNSQCMQYCKQNYSHKGCLTDPFENNQQNDQLKIKVLNQATFEKSLNYIDFILFNKAKTKNTLLIYPINVIKRAVI